MFGLLRFITQDRSTEPRTMLRITIALLLALGLVTSDLWSGRFPRAGAQEGTPAPDAATMTDAETQSVVDAYIDALLNDGDFAQCLAEDIVLTVMDTGQEVSGRQAVVDTIIALHQEMFDAQPEVTGVIVGEGAAAVEFVFAGTHTDEFAGIPATGREVRVPYAAFYDLAENEITAIRLFGFASGLVMQLTAEGTPVP